MRCEKHTRYRGKGQPRSACCQCWSMWLIFSTSLPDFADVFKKFKVAVLRERIVR